MSNSTEVGTRVYRLQRIEQHVQNARAELKAAEDEFGAMIADGDLTGAETDADVLKDEIERKLRQLREQVSHAQDVELARLERGRTAWR